MGRGQGAHPTSFAFWQAHVARSTLRPSILGYPVTLVWSPNCGSVLNSHTILQVPPVSNHDHSVSPMNPIKKTQAARLQTAPATSLCWCEANSRTWRVPGWELGPCKQSSQEGAMGRVWDLDSSSLQPRSNSQEAEGVVPPLGFHGHPQVRQQGHCQPWE